MEDSKGHQDDQQPFGASWRWKPAQTLSATTLLLGQRFLRSSIHLATASGESSEMPVPSIVALRSQIQRQAGVSFRFPPPNHQSEHQTDPSFGL